MRPRWRLFLTNFEVLRNVTVHSPCVWYTSSIEEANYFNVSCILPLSRLKFSLRQLNELMMSLRRNRQQNTQKKLKLTTALWKCWILCLIKHTVEMSFIVVAKCIVRARVALARLHGCIVDTRKRNSALLKTIWPPVRAKGFYSKT